MRLDLCQQDRLAERAESIVQSALLLKVTSCPGVNFDIAIIPLPASADFSIAYNRFCCNPNRTLSHLTSPSHHQYPAQAKPSSASFIQTQFETPLQPPTTKKQKRTNPITPNLLPLHLLPRNRQRPPKRLKRALAQRHKPPIQLLLIPFLGNRYRPQNLLCRGRGRGQRKRKRLTGREPHVAVFVVVHADGYGASEGGGARCEVVGGAVAAVPKVGKC